MKPIWRETKIVQIVRQLYEKYSCISDCGKKQKCQVVVPIDKEPPKNCEEAKNENNSPLFLQDVRQGQEN